MWTSADLLSNGTLGTNFSKFFNQNSKIFTRDNAFENVVWKMAAFCHGLNVLAVESPLKRGVDICLHCDLWADVAHLKPLYYI